MVETTNQKARKQAIILGVGMDSTSRSRLLAKIAKKISHRRVVPVMVVTPNPEILLRAQEDLKLKEILNDADISLPDGMGVVWAAHFLGYAKPDVQIRGREFFSDLIKLAKKRGWKVALIGSSSAIGAAERLSAAHPNLYVLGLIGPKLTQDGTPVTQKDRKVENEIVGRLKDYKPTMLFVGFGAPKQEKWIARWQRQLGVPLAMAVGGAFDVVSGKLAAPPVLVEKLGLEWLWRGLSQPQRAGRIFRAIIVFPLTVVVSFLGVKSPLTSKR